MRDKNSEVRVGILVIISLLILLFAILWSKEFTLSRDQQVLQIIFSSAAGLEKGDPVTIAGIKVGRVHDIELYNGNALVTCTVSEKITLHSDMQAHIQSAELMGTEMIVLFPGESNIILQKDDLKSPIAGSSSFTVGEIILVLGSIAKQTQGVIAHLDTAVSDFNTLFFGEENKKSLVKSIKNLEYSSANLKKLIEDNNHAISTTLSNLNEVSTTFKSLIVSHEGQLDSSLTKFVITVNELNHFSKSLNSMMSQINEGHGTIGKLLHDDGTYERIQNITHNLETLSFDLKNNLGRYLAGTHINLLNLFEF